MDEVLQRACANRNRALKERMDGSAKDPTLISSVVRLRVNLSPSIQQHLSKRQAGTGGFHNPEKESGVVAPTINFFINR